MKYMLLLLVLINTSYSQDYDGICQMSANGKKWTGFLVSEGVLTVSHPQESECVSFFDNERVVVGIRCQRLKENRLADIALYRCEIPNDIKIKRHNIKKHDGDVKIIGYIGSTRVVRSGKFLYNGTVDGFPIIGYNCEATNGMSGSPVFGEEVTGIQFGGNKTSTDTIAYETIKEFLNDR